MATQSPAAQRRALRILLIEDDPIDAAWITELIHEKHPTAEVVHSSSLPDALSVLAQRPIDTAFISAHPNGEAASVQNCREMVRRAGRRSVVALVNVAEMDHAADVRATGVRFIYRKHPIMRTAYVRKQELREKLGFGLEDDRTTQTNANSS